MGVYTSSQVEKFGDTLPIGVIQVPAVEFKTNLLAPARGDWFFMPLP